MPKSSAALEPFSASILSFRVPAMESFNISVLPSLLSVTLSRPAPTLAAAAFVMAVRMSLNFEVPVRLRATSTVCPSVNLILKSDWPETDRMPLPLLSAETSVSASLPVKSAGRSSVLRTPVPLFNKLRWVTLPPLRMTLPVYAEASKVLACSPPVRLAD